MLTLKEAEDLTFRINHIQVEMEKFQQIEELEEFKQVFNLIDTALDKVWSYAYEVKKRIQNDTND